MALSIEMPDVTKGEKLPVSIPGFPGGKVTFNLSTEAKDMRAANLLSELNAQALLDVWIDDGKSSDIWEQFKKDNPDASGDFYLEVANDLWKKALGKA